MNLLSLALLIPCGIYAAAGDAYVKKSRSMSSSRALRGIGNGLGDTRIELFNQQHRSLLELGSQNNGRYMGERELLVIRIDADDSSTTRSQTDLANDIFKGDINVGKVFESCSRGKLSFRPATGSNIQDGVATVNLSKVVGRMAYDGNTTKDSIAMEIASSSESLFGRKLEEFDEVMMCMPKGAVVVAPNGKETEQYAAFAAGDFPYSAFLSIYHDTWCSSLSGAAHEIGHTFNLNHANFEEGEYNDESGMMGYSTGPSTIGYETSPSKCFNPAKSWQLGWYAEQSIRINPFIDAPFSTILTGITRDPNDNDPTRKILLQIPNGNSNLYVGYNLAVEYNNETKANFANKVLIEEQDYGSFQDASKNFAAARRPPKSDLVARLNETSYVVQNYEGSGRNLIIKAKKKIAGRNEIPVEIYFQDANPSNEAAKCDTNKVRFETVFTTPGYSNDTVGWELKDSANNRVVFHDKEETEVYSLYIKSACIERGQDYTFTLTDDEGRGLCCRYGWGSYHVYLEGEEIFRGGEFGAAAIGRDATKSVVHTFTVPDPPPPTAYPTPLSTPYPTPSPTPVPTILPPPTGSCTDDESFRHRGADQWNCAWVGEKNYKEKRCDTYSNDGKKMKVFCPEACGLCPTSVPTKAPSQSPTPAPTSVPTKVPSQSPTPVPTSVPTKAPSQSPTPVPTSVPTKAPSQSPTPVPTSVPTKAPSPPPTPNDGFPVPPPTDDTCTDNKGTFMFRRKRRNCKWVRKKKKKNKLCGKKKIWKKCKLTCEKCPKD